MLVLSRQKDQTIMIGDDIEVTVVDIRGDKVRLGINAPRTITVHRKEVYDLLKREGQQAGGKGAGHEATAPSSPPPAQGENSHDPFLREAIDEARRGLADGGLPIGSVLVRNGKVIGRGHNRRVQKGDPMAHAEIDCLTNAGRQKSYKDTILYSTLMPCFLCSGAIVQFGIPRIVVGESVNFPGAPGFLRHQGVHCVDLHDAECIQMMGEFIKAHPDLWHEDIGK
ncbi:MAG TPA: carbon storage regulator CsrA [Tepidisphaeraceae bacterium]|jgi:cytosine deaminase